MSDFVDDVKRDAQYLLDRLTLNSAVYDIASCPVDQEAISHNFQTIEEICKEASLPSKKRSPRPSYQLRRRKFSDPFKFPRFIELPLELRRQIWRCAIETRWKLGRQNGIEVHVAQEKLYQNPSECALFATCKWDKILPPLLQTCHESRVVVLENFPHSLTCLNSNGLIYFHGGFEAVHVRKMQMFSAPESFVAFGSLSKPLRRNRNLDLPLPFFQIERLKLDFESCCIMEKTFPGDYLILLCLFPNLKHVEGCVAWERGDVEKDQKLELVLRELEGKWPDFWRRAQRRYMVSSNECSKIDLRFEIDDLVAADDTAGVTA